MLHGQLCRLPGRWPLKLRQCWRRPSFFPSPSPAGLPSTPATDSSSQSPSTEAPATSGLRTSLPAPWSALPSSPTPDRAASLLSALIRMASCSVGVKIYPMIILQNHCWVSSFFHVLALLQFKVLINFIIWRLQRWTHWRRLVLWVRGISFCARSQRRHPSSFVSPRKGKGVVEGMDQQVSGCFHDFLPIYCIYFGLFLVLWTKNNLIWCSRKFKWFCSVFLSSWSCCSCQWAPPLPFLINLTADLLLNSLPPLWSSYL